MRDFIVALAVACMLLVSAASAVEPRPKAAPPGTPKLPPGFDIEKMADAKEAATAADWLEKEYADKKTEAVKMLVAILRGMKADGSNGWFGPAESRFSWAWLAQLHGLEAKAARLPKKDFRGSDALFDQLDRDGDGSIAPTDLDWSDTNPYVQQAAAVTRIFRRMDGNTDGELTRAELDAFFQRVGNGKESITADDLRRLLIPRGPRGFAPGDAPSVPVLLKGFFSSEIGSLSEGPHLGDSAPSFNLGAVDGTGEVQFAKLLGKKPVVLILGNFTCGPFRALYPDLEAIHRRHKNNADFLMVYVREAHPTDGWKMEQNERLGVAVKQPTTLGERTKVAGQFCTKLKPAMPVLVDEIDDRVGNLYSGMPGRLYVIDGKGKIAYKSGRGPFGFRAGEMEQALVMTLLEAEGKK
jgi:thiol-disulfide isomerase/thioredoxin/Ca2+-binding EF-hand superfamily protein